jgi:hypothetical protein
MQVPNAEWGSCLYTSFSVYRFLIFGLRLTRYTVSAKLFHDQSECCLLLEECNPVRNGQQNLSYYVRLVAPLHRAPPAARGLRSAADPLVISLVLQWTYCRYVSSIKFIFNCPTFNVAVRLSGFVHQRTVEPQTVNPAIGLSSTK